MRVWKFNQRDSVAAESLEDAVAWYGQHVGIAECGNSIEECSLQTIMKVEVNEVENALVTFEERIEQMAARGMSFPAIIAIDTDYRKADQMTLDVIKRARGR